MSVSLPSPSLWEIIFKEKFLKDDRQAAWTIDIVLDQKHQLIFLLPKYQFYLQIIVILSTQMLLGSLLGMLLYYGIFLPQQQQQQQESKKRNGYSIFLIGYGIIIPMALYIPFWIVDQFDIQNVLLRLGCIAISMTTPLRCLEAMHYYHMPTTDKNHRHNNALRSYSSCRDYVSATSFTFRPALDEKGNYIAFTAQSMMHVLRMYLTYMAIISVVCSILAPVQYSPFPNNNNNHPNNHPPMLILTLHWSDWYNAFVQAAVISLVLQFSLSGTAALAGLYTGIQYEYKGITNHPMFCSQSPSDFWGRRWNNLIHSDLKRGVYLPLRQRNTSKLVAALMTFLVSGLLHEHVWMVLFFYNHDNKQLLLSSGDNKDNDINQNADYWFGKQLVFFGWNGILLSLEYLLGGTLGTILRKTKTPRFIQSHLVVLLALPLAHLFTTDMTVAGGFIALQSAVPMIAVVAVKQ